MEQSEKLYELHKRMLILSIILFIISLLFIRFLFIVTTTLIPLIVFVFTTILSIGWMLGAIHGIIITKKLRV